jgi:predicted MFS family arabinose efflux permease
MMRNRALLIIVCVALSLDNLLHTFIVPMLPYLTIDVAGKLPPADRPPKFISRKTNFLADNVTNSRTINCSACLPLEFGLPNHTSGEFTPSAPQNMGLFVASKACVQLFIDLIFGSFIDRVTYESSLFVGLNVLFSSTVIFAFVTRYEFLLTARCIQGVGSALAHTAGLALLASRFTDTVEQTEVLGIAATCSMFGYLIAPASGGFLHQFVGKTMAFLLLAVIAFVDGIMVLLLVWKPWKVGAEESTVLSSATITAEKTAVTTRGTPLYRLMLDPYIVVVVLTVVTGNLNLAFLEPTIAMWMESFMDVTEWQIGVVWLPTILAYALGLYVTTQITRFFPQNRWLITLTGMIVESVSCICIPFCSQFALTIIPLMTNCFGVSLIDSTVMPVLIIIADIRHSSSYGSVNALIDICFLSAFALGPLLADWIFRNAGFFTLMMIASVTTAVYAPLLFSLRSLYKYEKPSNESDAIGTHSNVNISKNGYFLMTTSESGDSDNALGPHSDVTNTCMR